ncbi:hypothetical protein H0H81_009031 [Sphagnurus paluster]|uniref:F-box domain-containing protein n=1 Tax=Sphagnurus paluster TaxID=117069 RepID=A0A9P7FSA8_9AGAR|nr:hypothetical protein H0H81_009031 [Sphagnurus paluster]
MSNLSRENEILRALLDVTQRERDSYIRQLALAAKRNIDLEAELELLKCQLRDQELSFTLMSTYLDADETLTDTKIPLSEHSKDILGALLPTFQRLRQILYRTMLKDMSPKKTELKPEWYRRVQRSVLQEHTGAYTRARVWLRKKKEPVTEERVLGLVQENNQFEGLNLSDILVAFESGEEVVNLIRLECIAYDRAFIDDLPPEVLGQIIGHMERKDLVAVATTSSVFQDSAESILYSTVDLTHRSCDPEKILSWCRSVTAVPRRARKVYKLRFPSTLPTRTDQLPSLHEITLTFKAAFDSIVNLKHLIFVRRIENGPPTLHLSILQDCTFRLSSLAGDTIPLLSDQMWDFLDTQPDIEYWAPSTDFLRSCTTPLPPVILPRLRQAIIVGLSKSQLLRGRYLEYLMLLDEQNMDAQQCRTALRLNIQSFSNTLQTLFYVHFKLNISPAELISCIADSAPRLVSLTLYHMSAQPPLSRNTTRGEQPQILNAVARLPLLQTLVLNTFMEILVDTAPTDGRPECGDLDSRDRQNWVEAAPESCTIDRQQCRHVASAFMAACPRLEKLSFPIDAQGVASVTYLRSQIVKNTAIFDGFYSVDTSSWWRI